METELGFDPETMEPIHLGELLACNQDDPSVAASRELDWQDFIDSHDYRYGVIGRDMVQDKTALEEARKWGERYHRVRSLRDRLPATCASIWGRMPGAMTGGHVGNLALRALKERMVAADGLLLLQKQRVSLLSAGG